MVHHSDGEFDINADGEIELNSDLIDINGLFIDASSTITASGRIIVDDTTDITSTTDGSLQTDGGLSVAKNAIIGVDLKVGDDLVLNSDAGRIFFGSDLEVVLTHVHNTGLKLNSSKQLQFGDDGTYIHQSADGVLDLVSDCLEINATTIDINGAVDISGNTAIAGTLTVGGDNNRHHQHWEQQKASPQLWL